MDMESNIKAMHAMRANFRFGMWNAPIAGYTVHGRYQNFRVLVKHNAVFNPDTQPIPNIGWGMSEGHLHGHEVSVLVVVPSNCLGNFGENVCDLGLIKA